MTTLQNLFENNRAWAERIRSDDARFFPKLSRLQRPYYLLTALAGGAR